MQEPELKFEIYQDVQNEWRWRLKARNQLTIADSSEGYKNQTDCVAMVNKIKTHARDAGVDYIIKVPR
jgi:uncharacterized protein YegP (UPF0339 family)